MKSNFISGQNNLADKSISTKIGVKYVDMSTEYINMGKSVERSNNEMMANMSQITAYPDLYTNLDVNIYVILIILLEIRLYQIFV